MVQGQLIADAGTIADRDNDKVSLNIDRADFRFNWDARRRSLVVPFQVNSGGNQFTMRATLEGSPEQNGTWLLGVMRGDSVIDPIIIAPGATADDEGIAINRVAVRARIDTNRKRIELEQGDFSRIDTRPSHNIGIAVTGSLDYSGAEPHIAFGVAGTRMPMSALKRLWPFFAAVAVRNWVEEHISGGMVERVVVAGNAPLEDFKHNGPPVPEDGLSVDIETSGTTLRPISNLPPIRDADLTVRITGRNAIINLGRGTVEAAPGRKLNIASGVFEVPDTHPKPAPARASFRIDGGVPAAAALLASDGLRDEVGITLDPATTRGTISAQVAVKLAIAEPMPRGRVELSDQCGPHEFLRRQDAARAESGSLIRSRPWLPGTASRSKATSRSMARPRRSICASRKAKPTPNCTCSRPSTRRRGAGSGWILAPPSPAPFLSRSSAGSVTLRPMTE